MTIVYENRLLENQIRSNLVLASARITFVFCRLTVEHIFLIYLISYHVIGNIFYRVAYNNEIPIKALTQENSTVSNLLSQFNSTRKRSR